MGISMGELRTICERGPLWQGLTQRNDIPLAVQESIDLGLIERNPHGHGFVATAKGREMVDRYLASFRQVCPRCGGSGHV